MNRRTGIMVGLALASLAAGGPAEAQMMYPGGYGGYGMSAWGADPGAGFMAGLGAYSRGRGVYAVEKAQADALNLQTMIKWNQALRVRQAQLRADKAKADARRDAERQERVDVGEERDGTTLNTLLLAILDSDPGAAHAGRTATPLSAAAIREIPFEWDSEAVTLCLDQMTGEGSLPGLLAGSEYQADRDALRKAVTAALAEDVKGPVSAETLQRVRDAVAGFRASFQKHAADFEPGYLDAKNFLTTLDGLSRLLDDPSMKALLKELDAGGERTVGDLIAFMNAFNLRFGPATTERQAEIYSRLIPALAAVRDAAVAARTVAPAPADPSGAALRAAATDAFKGMSWKELDAHAQSR
ncbi:hypothetical protein [Planctomyces sp. SH-PL62]|uniref:hypothetical protein n=1 Tax=Planctomyces sp. SH-PL62 TaxID=1636152 RepID=UPI00078D545F|nr:hypothetical protein [Planctomyces sp. SH-PL62]AMV40747.1 hypothetical protein VT85_25165 [Planctomyces sp. SH-PL62]